MKILAQPSENENVEFKEAKNSFSVLGRDNKRGKKNRKSIYGYSVAIGNEGGGHLILGVKDKINKKTGRRDIVGTKAIQNITQTKEKLYEALGRRVEIQTLKTPEGTVQVIEIPAHPVGGTFKFYNVPLMRNGENLVPMDDETLKKILTENREDFSAKLNLSANFDDLDPKLLRILKDKYILKSGNKELKEVSHKDILQKLLLVRKDKITNACLLLVGKEDSLARLIPNHEIFLEWRSDEHKLEFENRYTTRKAYLSVEAEIWKYVNARNVRVPFKQGFFEMDIWAYDKNSVRESVLNAFAHREYDNRTEPVYVRLSPSNLSIKSPGGFVSGVSVENILDVEGKWRNPFLMDVLSRIGLVERAGIGLDRIYKKTISDGKGLPNFDGTDNDQVILNIPAIVKDPGFIYYLEKINQKNQLFSSTKDFIELEKIRGTGIPEDKNRLKYFLKNNIIEKINHGRGTRYILAKNFYEFIEGKGEYTRKKWLSKEQQKEVLLNYFIQHKEGRMSDFKELFEDKLNKIQINILLNKLRDEEMIYFDGKERSSKAYWRLRKNTE